MKKLFLILSLIFLINFISSQTIETGTNLTSVGLNSKITVSFTLTFDRLDVLTNAITFYNLTYIHPSSCSQQSSYSIYNFTTANSNTNTNNFPLVACPEESSGSSGGSGSTTSSTEKTTSVYWSGIIANEEKYSSINVNGIYITNISLKTNKNISSASIKIQTLNLQNNSNLFSDLNVNNIFQGIKINKTGITDGDLNEVYLSFKINNSWLENKNISNIVLQRKSENSSEWEMLNTTYLMQDENYSYFKSFSKGFSYFVIYYNGLESEVETIAEEEIGEVTSVEEIKKLNLNEIIFWIIVGVIVLIILVVGFILIKDLKKIKK
ncbi:MAG: PGF-pre-PGF domain-containing protein [Candidatus Pacearchaeota archaeon]